MEKAKNVWDRRKKREGGHARPFVRGLAAWGGGNKWRLGGEERGKARKRGQKRASRYSDSTDLEIRFRVFTSCFGFLCPWTSSRLFRYPRFLIGYCGPSPTWPRKCRGLVGPHGSESGAAYRPQATAVLRPVYCALCPRPYLDFPTKNYPPYATGAKIAVSHWGEVHGAIVRPWRSYFDGSWICRTLITIATFQNRPVCIDRIHFYPLPRQTVRSP